MAGEPVTILPHDPSWSRRFAAEAGRLLELFAGEALGVHHIGSTAVPGLVAKPTLDVLLVARSLGGLDVRRGRAEALGYDWRGEYGIAGRRFLVARLDGGHAMHVHAFEAGDSEIERHLDFRDYLLSHPERAAAYGRLKHVLAARFASDRQGYTDAKTGFIRETEALARRWRGRR